MVTNQKLNRDFSKRNCLLQKGKMLKLFSIHNNQVYLNTESGEFSLYLIDNKENGNNSILLSKNNNYFITTRKNKQ